jgi:hypothetical protein
MREVDVHILINLIRSISHLLPYSAYRNHIHWLQKRGADLYEIPVDAKDWHQSPLPKISNFYTIPPT